MISRSLEAAKGGPGGIRILEYPGFPHYRFKSELRYLLPNSAAEREIFHRIATLLPREKERNKSTDSHIFGAADDENAGDLSEERERGSEQRNREELCCQIKHTKKKALQKEAG
jgi:hypothetical protein